LIATIKDVKDGGECITEEELMPLLFVLEANYKPQDLYQADCYQEFPTASPHTLLLAYRSMPPLRERLSSRAPPFWRCS
jgi:hypothetical protein